MRIISFSKKLIPPLVAGRKTVTRRAWKTNPYVVGDWAQAWAGSPRNGGRRVGYVFIRKIEKEPLGWIRDFYEKDELQKEGGLWKTATEFIQDVQTMSPGIGDRHDVFRLEISFFRRLPRGVLR